MYSLYHLILYAISVGILYGLIMFFEDPEDIKKIIKHSVIVSVLVILLLYYLHNEKPQVELYIDQPNW